MTRSRQNRRLPRLLVSSTLGTTLVSLAAAWIVISLSFGTTPHLLSAVHDYQPHGQHFQLSPIPPGADWTS
jgi:hypothetical protein